MNEEVPYVKLADVAEVIPGTSPSGRDINSGGEGVPFYQGAKEFGTRHPRPERFTTAPVKTAKTGDILLSVRAPVGRVNIANHDCAIGRGVMAVRAKSPSDAPYLEWFLRTLGEDWDAHATDGTMFANLSKRGLEALPVRWPLDRNRIAEVLGTVDERIESLSRLQTLLQGSALATYELSTATFSAVALSSVCEVTMGNSPPGSSYNEEGIGTPLFQGSAEFGFRYPTERLYTTAPGRLASPNDTLVSVRAPVGRLNRALVSCCIGRGVGAARSDKHPSLLYYALMGAESSWDPYNSQGTVFGSINGGDLRALLISWPENPDSVEMVLAPLDSSIHQYEVECAVLSEARRFLLPALISGELRVEAAEEIVEDVA